MTRRRGGGCISCRGCAGRPGGGEGGGGGWGEEVVEEGVGGGGGGGVIVDRMDGTRRRGVSGAFEELLVPVMRGGRVVYASPGLGAIRAQAQGQLARFYP